MDLTHWNEHAERLSEFHELLRGLMAHFQCCTPEPEFLFSVSYALQNRGEIVEIGTSVGTSVLALAMAQKVKRTGRPVTTIDMNHHIELDSNIARANLREYINVVISKSADLARGWTKPIEFLWIDGDHSYRGCLADIRNWSRQVTKGGYIGFHDFADGMGVAQAVYEALLSRPWLYRVESDRNYGSIFLLEKIAEEDAVAPWSDRMQPMT